MDRNFCMAVYFTGAGDLDLTCRAPALPVDGCIFTLRTPIAARQGILGVLAAICASLLAGPTFVKELLDTGEAAEKRAKKERVRKNPERVRTACRPSTTSLNVCHLGSQLWIFCLGFWLLSPNVFVNTRCLA